MFTVVAAIGLAKLIIAAQTPCPGVEARGAIGVQVVAAAAALWAISAGKQVVIHQEAVNTVIPMLRVASSFLNATPAMPAGL